MKAWVRVSAWQYVRRLLARRFIPWLQQLGRTGLDRTVPLASLSDDLIGQAIVTEGRYERDELESLRQILLACPNRDVMVDVGANIGHHTLCLADLFSMVISYEPHPIALHLLHANVLLNQAAQVRIRPVGLSDQAGQAHLRVVNTGNLGSAQARFDQPAGEPIVLCHGDTDLDTLLASDRRVDFLKIDVEGMEARVVAGLRKRLRQDQPLLAFEALNTQAFTETTAILQQCGYRQFATLTSRGSIGSRYRRFLVRLFGGYQLGLQVIDAMKPQCANLILAVPERLYGALGIPE